MEASPALLAVSDAQARILETLTPLPAEPVPLHNALGRVLAQDIYAPLDLPPFSNSSMDGYAVRAADVAAAPTTLQVVADIAAGHVSEVELAVGQAARITTGAPMPAGTDSVVPVELTDDSRSSSGARVPQQVTIMEPVRVGAHVRLIGEDVAAGECVLHAHTLVAPTIMGVLAALGLAEVPVFKKPRVAILGTGDEVADLHEPLGPGQVRNVNAYTLSALVSSYGGAAINLGVARDTVAAVQEKLRAALEADADLIVTSAGVSMGATDVVRLAMEQRGKLQFWRVNMRPGKPVAFGFYEGTPLLGLPGNPVSSIVACEVFVRPAILQLGGHASTAHPTIRVRMAEPVHSDGRETYFRARVRFDPATGNYVAHSAGGQGSHMLHTLAEANCLVIIPAGRETVAADDELEAWLLADRTTG